PITQNPINGNLEVATKTGTNVPENTVNQFNDFGNRLLAEVQKRGGKLSAADVEEMRKSKVIDPDYGRISTEAPDLAINQKAGRVASLLVKAGEDAVRLPNGQSALELLNSHMADLMQGNKVVPEKLAANRVSAPRGRAEVGISTKGIRFNSGVTEGPNNFNAGAIKMPIKTGLASMLTDKPWWLKDPTQGLQQAFPTAGRGAPMPNLPSGQGAPNPTTGASVMGGSSQPVPSGVQINFPKQPTDFEVGQHINGLDSDGYPVSGELKKMYATVENGKPQWKALVLDKAKGQVVEVPAEQLYNSPSSNMTGGPPGPKGEPTNSGQKLASKGAPGSDPFADIDKLDKDPIYQEFLKDLKAKQDLAQHPIDLNTLFSSYSREEISDAEFDNRN
ncbi:MAG: hypothetical protein ACHP6H_07175, partial [Legionellales bacterium]